MRVISSHFLYVLLAPFVGARAIRIGHWTGNARRIGATLILSR